MDNGLIENKNVRQREEEGYRRWFLNDFFDVIIWYDKPKGSMKGFQVCYSKNRNEKAFTWSERMASSRYVSDDEDGRRQIEQGLAVVGRRGYVERATVGRGAASISAGDAVDCGGERAGFGGGLGS